eukprot:scaffold42345_cov33-Phaeocystis_antarctica.AAC.1
MKVCASRIKTAMGWGPGARHFGTISPARQYLAEKMVSRAAVLVRQHIDGVARASKAVAQAPRADRSRARSLVLLTMLASVTRCAELGDQLQLDDEVIPPNRCVPRERTPYT